MSSLLTLFADGPDADGADATLGEAGNTVTLDCAGCAPTGAVTGAGAAAGAGCATTGAGGGGGAAGAG